MAAFSGGRSEVEGSKDTAVNVSTITDRIWLTTENSLEVVEISNFIVDGPSNLGPTGTAIYRVAAMAHIPANVMDGDYIGSNTFRVVYN